MNRTEQTQWKCEVLDEVFCALAASKPIEENLVFKGARVLQVHLGGGRQSLDIDSNLLASFVERHPSREDQRTFLEREMARSIRQYFERHNPVRFELINIKVQPRPRQAHPRGWDAFEVRLNVNDLRKQLRGLPALEIDVAAPEELLASSIMHIDVGGHSINAYTLQRIAGEKLRAFLSSLPAYRAKVNKPGDAIRAKDLYDVARILRAHPISETEFWSVAGEEFKIACKSRYIDCAGLPTFQEAWELTKRTYEEPIIPKDIRLPEAATALATVVNFFAERGIIPFVNPLPATA